jgi:hypothetical protein
MTDSDPDPGGPKTFGSGSTTLLPIPNYFDVIINASVRADAVEPIRSERRAE